MFLADVPLRKHGGTTCLLAVSVFRRLRRLAGSCEEHTASLSAFQPRSCGLCEGRRRDSRSSCPLCTIPRVGDSVCASRTAAFRRHHGKLCSRNSLWTPNQLSLGLQDELPHAGPLD